MLMGKYFTIAKIIKKIYTKKSTISIIKVTKTIEQDLN